ncbi:hypothetical protein MKW94_023079 [Papaver nudicaule]|uniref:SAWADEE domain-containing protein n=1 Tax=Papaver nudicaule TaxID=74823 RepID=A0AA41S598_PAPNU|nr:hypothetical protein [Papaver nudicaule]
MGRLRPRESPSFNKSEIEQMRNLLKDVRKDSLTKEFCEKLARKFSRDTGRAGRPAIQWEQVQDWFQDKCQASLDKVINFPLTTPNQEVDLSDTSISNSKLEDQSANSKGGKLLDMSDLQFEAKSAKDEAWYDVSLFLTHRVVSGEPEVRVRFVGFGAEEDEWVSIKKAVRERSIPIEPSECETVEVGDLVLCFQESEDQAIYFDAHILEINRRLHDIRGCRCDFLVRYVHDNSEESVRLRRLCRRPHC